MAAYLSHKKYPYYLPSEVVVHNKPDDIWVSANRRVMNVTPLVTKLLEQGSQECELLLAFAGKDISQWFNTDGELRDRVDPVTGVRTPCLPPGALPHMPLKCPTPDWQPPPEPPWWRDDQYHIGWVSIKPRHLRIINMLTASTKMLTVCEEETIYQIMERFWYANAHSGSYTWRSVRGPLDMSKTLIENDVQAEEYGEPPSPIFLYYNRDMTRDRYKAPREKAIEAKIAEDDVLNKVLKAEAEKQREEPDSEAQKSSKEEFEPVISEAEEEVAEEESVPEVETQPEKKMAQVIIDDILTKTMQELMKYAEEPGEGHEFYPEGIPYMDEAEVGSEIGEDAENEDFYDEEIEEELRQSLAPQVLEEGGGDAS